MADDGREESGLGFTDRTVKCKVRYSKGRVKITDSRVAARLLSSDQQGSWSEVFSLDGIETG